ncbi:MAG: type II toxin-antitoxin system RelE/ParE family toxin [Pseudomonadota bacterium]
MNYRLSAKAEADLVQIYIDGVTEFGVTQAEAYQDKIDQTIELIANNPEMARLREEISPPVRIHPVHAHVIVYLVDDNRMVRILRVRHGRENWPANPMD